MTVSKNAVINIPMFAENTFKEAIELLELGTMKQLMERMDNSGTA